MTAQIGAAVALTPSSNPYGPALLTRFEDHNGNLYIRHQAGAAIAAGEWIAISELGASALMTKALADAGHKLAVAQVAHASGDYGWALIRGVGVAMGLAECAADVPLYTSGTAGAADDASSMQTEIKGARLTAAVGAGGAAAAACLLAVEPHV